MIRRMLHFRPFTHMSDSKKVESKHGMQKVHKILENVWGVIRIKYKLYKTNERNVAYSRLH